MNHVLHIAAIAQIRHDTEGRAYYRRKFRRREDPRPEHPLTQRGSRMSAFECRGTQTAGVTAGRNALASRLLTQGEP